MEDRLVIGHDAGTSGDKAVLATVEGEIIASESRRTLSTTRSRSVSSRTPRTGGKRSR